MRQSPPTTPAKTADEPTRRAVHAERCAAWAAGPGLVLLCARFEGVDERVIEGRGFREVSIGDYVLSGGELAALAVLDACVRLLPGVMGKEASGHEESFSDGLLEYPQYTKPRDWEGRAIPTAAQRRPRPHPRLAARRGGAADARTPAGFAGAAGENERLIDFPAPAPVTTPSASPLRKTRCFPPTSSRPRAFQRPGRSRRRASLSRASSARARNRCCSRPAMALGPAAYRHVRRGRAHDHGAQRLSRAHRRHGRRRS